MWFPSWLRNLRRSDSTSTLARQRAAFRPQLEALESRWLLSTLIVMNTNDSGKNSLRADIAAAKSNDTIVFDPKLNGQTITLTSGELDITKNLTIQGAGQLTISSGDPARVFEVASKVTATLSGLAITDGFAGFATGGNIRNGGALTLSDCTVSGGYVHINPGSGIGGQGGGIYNYGTMTVSGCTVSDNSATYGGGICNVGTMIVSASTVSGNSAGQGGGIYNSSTMTIGSSSMVSGNSVDPNLITNDFGGGIYNRGKLTVNGGSTVSGNSADRGGGIYNANFGAATVSGSTVSGNSAGIGGGIYNESHGMLTVSDSIFSNVQHNSLGIYSNNIAGFYTDGGANTFS